MAVTDPIADMLTRIRNALIVRQETVLVPVSKMKIAIADILVNEGYIKSYKIVKEDNMDMMKIVLKYTPDRKSVILGLKRISKPGLRVYAKKEQIPKVLDGLGVAIVSTSAGIMTDKEARKAGMGGEVLCFVW
ncbi:MAG: 30S ribosomal protein S8 [Clostridiales bacterium]|nr:30S ribosomal protein S8 [Clostridiales bacterium]